MTSSSIASSKSSGKRDMCTPLRAGSRSTKQSISAETSASRPPCCMRTAFCTPGHARTREPELHLRDGGLHVNRARRAR